MSIYEDPRYIEQLADEAVAEDLAKQKKIEDLINKIHREFLDARIKNILLEMMELIV